MKLAFVLLALAVVFGAFGAHQLEKMVDARQLATWEVGARYHFYHALGLMGLALFSTTGYADEKKLKWAQNLLLAGIVLFSGSLYLLALRDWLGLEAKWIGPITPIGGVCFIAGWLVAAFSVKGKTQANAG